jgi:uncharacterized protein with von Willebrand factor type A (vWA) domain
VIEGQAFMFTPGGAIPMAQDGTPLATTGASTTEMSPGTVRRGAQTMLALPDLAPRVSELTPPSTTALRPKDVVKAAKARVREIRAELRHMKRLEQQLGELERLIAAAKHKPVALVRNIDHARQSR